MPNLRKLNAKKVQQVKEQFWKLNAIQDQSEHPKKLPYINKKSYGGKSKMIIFFVIYCNSFTAVVNKMVP